MAPILSPRERLVVALDVASRAEALTLARALAGRVGMLKVGLELFCAEGPAFVAELQALAPVFLDLKLHDIPTTVRRALDALLPLNPRLINVQAQGGPAMLEAAAAAVRAHRDRGGTTELLAVTVLTSLDRNDLVRAGNTQEPAELAFHLAKLAQASGCDGVVCSAQEAPRIREGCGEDFYRLCPGIRPAGEGTQDQSRVASPEEALELGAPCLGVGRPITRAADPAAAADAIVEALARSL